MYCIVIEIVSTYFDKNLICGIALEVAIPRKSRVLIKV
jgi:hypothetical protein